MRPAVILVTGGAGFVGSNLVRRLLAQEEDARVIVFDRSIDDLAKAFLAPFRDRVRLHTGDVTDPTSFDGVAERETITHVVHGAMVAHVPEWEAADPSSYVNVNVVGTMNTLEWARRLPALRRFLYVSSGGVYGDPVESSPEATQPESGPFNPPELYAISKYTSELLTRRYGELFGLDARLVRLSWVFGPMERVTVGRTLLSPPHAIVSGIVEDRPVTVTRRSLAAVGDFLSAEDIADAIAVLLTASDLRHAAYNVAAGELTTFSALLDAAAQVECRARFTVVDDDQAADLDHDPALRRARWNAYDIGRIGNELGWRPRPLVEQLRTYFDWALDEPQRTA